MHNSTNCQSEVFFALCKTVDTPVSLGAWLRYKYSHKEYLEMAINPRHYKDAASFAKDYAVAEYLSKSKDLNTGVDLKSEALRRFTLAEQNCARLNRNFRSTAFWAENPTLSSVLYRAQRKIARMLGSLDEAKQFGLCEWGPGATFEIPRRRAFVDTKMSEVPLTVTRLSLAYAKEVIERDLHWSHVILGTRPEGAYSLLPGVFQVTDRNRVTTVPKSAKTDRTIAIEPRMNTYLQKSVGSFIRRRLKRWGQDLDDQGRNQRLAADAVRLGLATIDLSMASDSVASELVAHLLPYDWWSFLMDLRAPLGELPDGEPIRYEKFSSMGNGFTFELETLIFYAIAKSVCTDEIDQDRKEVVSVYGDDIIVPAEISGQLISILNLCGFDVNQKKTYTDGLFYESCGRHYFDSIEVTPVYQKESLDGVPERMRAANRLLRLGWVFLGRDRKISSIVKPAWDCVRRFTGSMLHVQSPFGCEDESSFQVPLTYLRYEKRHSSHGILCRVLSGRRRSLPAMSEAYYATRLRQLDLIRDRSGYWSEYRHAPWQVQRERSATVTRKGEYVWDRSDDVQIISNDLDSITTRWIIPPGDFEITFDK